MRKAYAATNHLEYFAELSCMYFVGCNYEPFDREAWERLQAELRERHFDNQRRVHHGPPR